MNKVVLLKSHFHHQGGLEKYASRIARAFLEKGNQVTILTTGSSPPRSEIPIIATRTIAWPAFIRMEQFDSFVRAWLKIHPAQLIFGMDRNRYQTHIRAGNGVHAAYLRSRFLTDGLVKARICRFNPLHRKILELERRAFENPALQKLFTNSEMVRHQILDHYATDPSKIQVIHNGVEWHEMQNDFSIWENRKQEGLAKYSLDPNQFHLLFIGNGYSRKGLDRLLFALSQLKKEPFQLYVLGKDNQMDQYLIKAAQLGLKTKVHFFGQSQESRLFYQLADCLIIPSFYDPFANVTIEALAMGLFVISSKLNGGHEILTPENGTVIENLLDPEAIIHSLRIAMKHKKTKQSAEKIRASVKHLDFSNQLKILVESCG